MILNLNNLETLKLRSVKIVDDLFLYNLSRKCLNLKHLNLAQCNKVSDTGIIELTKLDKLEELILNRSTNNIVDISDKSIRQFRNLKKLHCFGCDCVTHDGIIKVLKNSPELELLDIGNTEVSPTIFLPIASSLTRHRTNNIILTLKVDLVWDIFAPDPRKTIEPSPYLIIDKS
ncbi:F-box protein SKP2B-like [Aphidius gifuensis]|nr:F-box protein SKP2B-like [Aphidius gifuensis]